MPPSKEAKAADAAHIRRMKKQTPKARFKALSKKDQYAVAARTLSHLLEVQRQELHYPERFIYNSYQITVSGINRRLIEKSASTGFLTDPSVKRIKRSMSNAVKGVLGPDAAFLFCIEQQDKHREICDPHIHAIVNLNLNDVHRLRERLEKLFESTVEVPVKLQRLSYVGEKREKELAPSEANFRRTSLYEAKNDQTHFYRSRSLMDHVHQRFEELKEHHLKKEKS